MIGVNVFSEIHPTFHGMKSTDDGKNAAMALVCRGGKVRGYSPA
jgi:hypothetical protein